MFHPRLMRQRRTNKQTIRATPLPWLPYLILLMLDTVGKVAFPKKLSVFCCNAPIHVVYDQESVTVVDAVPDAYSQR